MSYTGDVAVGGPAQVRELPALIISKVAVGPYNNNCYVLRCRSTGTQLLIDAADEPDVLSALVGADGLESIVTTHRHGDHWQALAALDGCHRRHDGGAPSGCARATCRHRCPRRGRRLSTGR